MNKEKSKGYYTYNCILMSNLTSTSISIKSFPAEDGDCILIGFQNTKANVLIDFGRVSTYTDFLKKELQELNAAGQILDLVVVTHIDADHIEGGLPFIIENGPDENIISVKEVWHNTYRHLQFKKQKASILPDQERKALKQIINSNLPPIASGSISDISARQGTSFGSYVLKHSYQWNKSFNGQAACVDVKKEIELEDIKFILLSPRKNDLEKLANIWLKNLESILPDFKITDDLIFDDAYEFYMRYYQENDSSLKDISSGSSTFNVENFAAIEDIDKSITNRSSISFIIEYENKKLLFLGDAHENVIYKSLTELLKSSYELKFDLVKVSHHGSNKNISNRLANLIDSKRYLFSSNGEKHNHPNFECIAKIINKHCTEKRELIFNYKLPKLKELDQFQEKYNFVIRYLNEFQL